MQLPDDQVGWSEEVAAGRAARWFTRRRTQWDAVSPPDWEVSDPPPWVLDDGEAPGGADGGGGVVRVRVPALATFDRLWPKIVITCALRRWVRKYRERKAVERG